MSDTLRPATIVLGKPNVDYDKKVLVFGFYGIIFIGTNNTMKRKSVPVIDLKDSKKWDGRFLCHCTLEISWIVMIGKNYQLRMKLLNKYTNYLKFRTKITPLQLPYV